MRAAEPTTNITLIAPQSEESSAAGTPSFSQKDDSDHKTAANKGSGSNAALSGDDTLPAIQTDTNVVTFPDEDNITPDDAAATPLSYITPEAAIKIALASYPEFQLDSIQLEDDNGALFYKIDLIDSAGKKAEIKVSAESGEILSAEVDDESEDSGDD